MAALGPSILRQRVGWFFVPILCLVFVWLASLGPAELNILFGAPSTKAEQGAIASDFTVHWRAAAAKEQSYQSDGMYRYLAEYFPQIREPSEVKPNFYPPIQMMLMQPLAALDLLPAFIVFSAAGLLVYAAGLCLLGNFGWPVALGYVFLSALLCLKVGQNGLFLTGLLAIGLSQLKPRPVLAGAALGFLVLKPHLFLLIPPWLLLRRAWGALVATLTTALILIIASACILGPESWRAYVHAASTHYGTVLTLLDYDLRRWPTVFGALRLLGFSYAPAFAIHFTVALAAILAAAWVSLKAADERLKIAALATAILLFPPYLYDYDFVLAIIPVIALVNFRLKPFEIVVLALLFILPPVYFLKIFTPPTLQLIPVAVMLLMLIICERARKEPASA